MRVAASLIALALSVTSIASATVPGLEDPVAVLVELNGDVKIQRAGTSAPESAGLGVHLRAGDRVLLANGGRAVLLYRTGRVHRASETLQVQDEGGERSGMFAQAAATLSQIASTNARAQPNRQGMIRPIAGSAVPISPRNGILIMPVRPSFVWYQIPGATGYTLQIGHTESSPTRLELGADTAWTLPPDLVLDPGGTYVWTVGASPDGRIAPPQEFRVATSEERREIRDRLSELRAAGLDPDGPGMFLAALVYRDAGFLYEANDLLDRIEAAGAGVGPAFYTLRGEVYDAIGRLEAAERAFELAGPDGSG